MIRNLIHSLSAAKRGHKRAILVSHDTVMMVAALWAAFSVRLGQIYFPNNVGVFAAALVSIVAGLVALHQLKVYRIVLRYFDMRTVSSILLAAVITSAAWVITVYFLRLRMTVGGVEILIPRSVGFIYCGFLFVGLFMGRYFMSIIMREAEGAPLHVPGREPTRIAIYGANSAGISLADSVRSNSNFRLCAFIDNDPALIGQIIAGTRIYGPDSIEEISKSEALEEVFLAIPKATRSERLAAISKLSGLNIKVKTVPAPEEIVSGRFTVSDVRPIEVNDLLRRDPVEPLMGMIQEAVEGRSILVTGAGGSIGSEICRQIIASQPRKLVLLDHSEYSLYAIEQQLLELVEALSETHKPQVVAVVGSMLNEPLVRSVVRREEIDTLYHAAAYKHVPLLEDNVVVGVENNVIGTLILANVAVEERLTRFTMISTDKAVRPESVMGASKRVAELIIQGLANSGDLPTRFSIVRFGNVLDSSGSVVQRFRRQISNGGPITVTHPEITRFFMSIPEATQLVLQASAMAEKGEVFVLDMGEPIRIAELAKQMISLSGMTVRDQENPSGDIQIEYVGLRPGEKLYEELFIGEDALATVHPRIKMANEQHIPFEEMRQHVEKLQSAIAAGDPEQVRAKLQELISPDKHHPKGAPLLKSA